jgi:hypothetical protein
MAFAPDIVVMSPDSPRTLLVVEVKAGTGDFANAEEQMKTYMVSMSAPTGLLITPERARIYRHTYSSHTPAAVIVAADVTTSDLLGASYAHVRGPEFERVVQGWLERLQGRTVQMPAVTRQAIEENILPALGSGVVRAARPTRRRVAS